MSGRCNTPRGLSPWFPVRIKPVRAGVYNVSCWSRKQTGNWYAYWDGERFGWFHNEPQGAFNMRESWGAVAKSWRGLTRKS